MVNLLQVKPEEVELIRRDYAANGGWETFLSYEDPRQDILVGLLRLRRVSGAVGRPRPGAAAARGACCGGSGCGDVDQASLRLQTDAAAQSDGVSVRAGGVGVVQQDTEPQPGGSRQVLGVGGSAAASDAAQRSRPAAAHGGRGVGSGAEAQPELRGRCSIVRELHVYGTAVAVHARDNQQQQHQVQREPCRSRWYRYRALIFSTCSTVSTTVQMDACCAHIHCLVARILATFVQRFSHRGSSPAGYSHIARQASI